ncbi:MAG: cytochrome b/b6 domain-containing protein [Gammaproteobacteria bacterium]|nr:cytochrome b/b6 domain-containing protein [Gammaproteobacteria bacterium]
MNLQAQIKIWDLPLRIFHWSLVSSFLISYITEDDFMTVHSYAGYTILALVTFRFIWGLTGSKHARFSDFICTPATTIKYLKDVLHNKAKRYLGHNPAGGVMVLALLVSLFLTTITGLAAFATEEGLGPLVSLMDTTPNYIFDAVDDVHEFFANFTLILIVFHIVGVAVTSMAHKENLVRAMITGYKNPN